MKEYIDREAAISLSKDIIVPQASGVDYKHRCIDPQDIREIPGADVVPVVRGKWERKRYGPWASGLKCSECELLFDIATDQPSWNYCPNCGAKMDGDSDDA